MHRSKLLTVLVLLGAQCVAGAPFTVASLGSAAEWNDHTTNTISLLSGGYDGSWGILAGAEWVSFKYTVCPGCPDITPYDSDHYYSPTEGDPFVIFTHTFNIPHGLVPIGGWLDILGDDSLSINLNSVGSSLKPGYAPYQNSFTEPDCYQGSPTRIAGCVYNYELNNGHGIDGGLDYNTFFRGLVPADNLLTFYVTNRGSNDEGSVGISSFGLSYILTLNLVPEEEAFTEENLPLVPPAFLPDPPVPEPGSLTLMALGGVALLAGGLRRNRT